MQSIHNQKLLAAYYSIPKYLNNFESRQQFIDWATDPEQNDSLSAIIDMRFHGHQEMAAYLHLTRKDNTKPYCIDNCTWQTRDYIRANARDARKLHYHGATYSIPEFCEVFDVKRSAVNYQISKLGLGNITDKVLDAVIAKQRAKEWNEFVSDMKGV